MTLLVREGDDVDALAGGRIGFMDGPGRLEGVNYTERTVQPAGLVLALDVRAGEDVRSIAGRAADDIGYAVDFGGMTKGLELLTKPAPRDHIVFRQCRSVHAGLESPNLAQLVEVAEQAFGVDLDHMLKLHHARDGTLDPGLLPFRVTALRAIQHRAAGSRHRRADQCVQARCLLINLRTGNV